MSAPEIRPRPQVSTFGGVEVPDPYGWLEADDEDVLLWQKALDAEAVQRVQGSAAFGPLHDLVREVFVDVFAFGAPRRAGGRWWRRVVPEGRQLQVVQVADAIAGPWRTVVDAADLGAGDHATLMYWEPSPDGRRLLHGVSAGGAQALHVRVVDVDSGETVLDGLPHPMPLFPSWLPDSDGFLYGAADVVVGEDGVPQALPRIVEVPLDGGAPQVADIELRHPASWPRVEADGRRAVVFSSQTDPRPVWWRDLTVEGAGWQPLLLEREGLAKGCIVGDELIAIVTGADAPRGRLVGIPLATPSDEATWRELLPHGDGKLASVQPLGDALLVCDLPEAAARLRLVDLDGTVRHEVPLPGPGAVGKTAVGHIMLIVDDAAWVDGTTATFCWSSLESAPVVLTYDAATGEVEQHGAPAAVLDGVRVTAHRATNATGGEVLYRVVAAPGATGPRPTIVTGYGGFNVPWLACWSSMAAAWVRAGGVWVHTYLRGGGELGEDHWRAGRMDRKAGSFDDLEAVCRALIADGVTTADQLGVTGSSNGGLLTGAAITRFPELIRAAVPQVPFLDPLGCRRDPHAMAIAMADYGNPEDPADVPGLLAWSPVHTVRPGTAYPAVLLDTGANDPVCPPWHGRKLAALLRDATTSDHPILLRVREEAGHNQMTEADMALRDAEELAFLADELGLDVG